jgi:hypothetical protein
MADRLDELARDAAKASALVGYATLEAANEILVGWLDMAEVESALAGLNEEIVVVGFRTERVDLVPGVFSNWEGKTLDPDSVDIEPARLEPGGITTVRVKVKPADGVVSGTYTGPLQRTPDHSPVVPEVSIYVVGDTEPTPPT